MPPVSEPLSASILVIVYPGDVVFAVSGALNAARNCMDVRGFVLIGTTTGIGGGVIRDTMTQTQPMILCARCMPPLP